MFGFRWGPTEIKLECIGTHLKQQQSSYNLTQMPVVSMGINIERLLVNGEYSFYAQVEIKDNEQGIILFSDFCILYVLNFALYIYKLYL